MHTSELVGSIEYPGKFMALGGHLILKLDILSFKILNSLISDIDFLLIYCNSRSFMWEFCNFLNVFEFGSNIAEIEGDLGLTFSCERYIIGVHSVVFLVLI